MSVVISNARQADEAAPDELHVLFNVSADKLQSIPLRLRKNSENFTSYVQARAERVFHLTREEELRGATLGFYLTNFAGHDFLKVTMSIEDLDRSKVNYSQEFPGRSKWQLCLLC